MNKYLPYITLRIIVSSYILNSKNRKFVMFSSMMHCDTQLPEVLTNQNTLPIFPREFGFPFLRLKVLGNLKSVGWIGGFM